MNDSHPIVADADIYNLAKATTGFTYYKNTPTAIDKASGSGHSQPLLRTRYNTKAATQLDANGKVISSPNFPDSSLVVKELLNADSTIALYAVIMKLRNAANADTNNWIWSILDASGGVGYPVANKGAACISCHSPGLDFTMMNIAHP